jgi:hypothetical protein
MGLHGVPFHAVLLSHLPRLHSYSYSWVLIAFRNEDHTVNLNISVPAIIYVCDLNYRYIRKIFTINIQVQFTLKNHTKRRKAIFASPL